MKSTISLRLVAAFLWLNAVSSQDNTTSTDAPGGNSTAAPVGNATDVPGTVVPISTNTTSNELTIEGEDGIPASAYPLSKCQGDCNQDVDCEAGLICFQRDAGNALTIPGCVGETDPAFSFDYCFDPLDIPVDELVIIGNNSVPAALFPLQKCQGDCDNDDDCADGLICFQRGDQPTIAGCTGTADIPEVDYCADPNDLPVDTLPPTAAPTVGAGDTLAPTAGDTPPPEETPEPTEPEETEPPEATPPPEEDTPSPTSTPVDATPEPTAGGTDAPGTDGKGKGKGGKGDVDGKGGKGDVDGGKGKGSSGESKGKGVNGSGKGKGGDSGKGGSEGGKGKGQNGTGKGKGTGEGGKGSDGSKGKGVNGTGKGKGVNGTGKGMHNDGTGKGKRKQNNGKGKGLRA